mgnify:CR=1 FL=1
MVKSFGEKGNLKFKIHYVNNKPNGLGLIYHENGNLKEKGEYKTLFEKRTDFYVSNLLEMICSSNNYLLSGDKHVEI